MKRVPRNYRGIEPTGKKIADLLPEALAKIERKRGDEKGPIVRFWQNLLGEKFAPLTECVSWEEGVLTVKVKSATLYSLLCQHEKVRLLKELRAKFPVVRSLVFRIG